MIQIRVGCLIVALLILGACGYQDANQEAKPTTSAEDVKEEVQEAIETIEQFSANTMREYQQSLQAKLQALNEKHEELEARAEEAGKDAKEQINTTLTDLKSKKEEVKITLDNLGTSTGKAWEEMRSGVEDAMKELEEGYDRALKEFSSFRTK